MKFTALDFNRTLNATIKVTRYSCGSSGPNTCMTNPRWRIAAILTSGSAMAEGPRDALVSRNSATTKYRYRVALFA